MLVKLAWRNIWRSALRSIVIMTAIIIGVGATVFILAFINGQIQSYINNTVQNEISHLQIHTPNYKDDYDVSLFFNDVNDKVTQISELENVAAAAPRTLINGIISSAKASRGVLIKGVVPDQEQAVTKMNEKIIEGTFLNSDARNPIIIGQALADKLKIKIRKKIVLRFQNVEGDIIDAAFRVAGIYKTNKSAFDRGTVFIRKPDLDRLLNIEEGAHEIAIFLKDEKQLITDKSHISDIAPGLLVETYEDISPDVRLFKSQINISAKFIMTIIMLALFFGIINTMLMAVLERYRELGMLMSVGMNKAKVFGMILIETLLLGLISAPIGMFLGYVAVRLTARNGIDLSAYSDGMAEFGMSSIVYPSLQSSLYIEIAIAVLITTVLAALYPAYKAIKLKPVEAIRKI